MNLGDIPFQQPVQDEVAPAAQRVSAGVGRLSDVVQQGLTQFGQALIQTQTHEAHLAASTKLDDLSSDLHRRPAIPVSEAKERLGAAFDELDPVAKAEGDKPVPKVDASGKPVLDPAGNPVMGEGQIPTFMIADRLYRKSAQEVLDESAKHITIPGWQGEFKRAAMGDIIARGARLDDRMREQAHQYQIDAVTGQTLEYATRGDFNMAKLRVESAKAVLGADGQMKLGQQVKALEQTKPIYDALLYFQTSPEEPGVHQKLEDAAKRLADQSQMTMVDPQHQEMLARQVHAALKQVDEGKEKRTAAGIAIDIASSSRREDQPDLIDPRAAVNKLDDLFRPGGKYAARPELRDEAWSALQKHIQGRNEITQAD